MVDLKALAGALACKIVKRGEKKKHLFLYKDRYCYRSIPLHTSSYFSWFFIRIFKEIYSLTQQGKAKAKAR